MDTIKAFIKKETVLFIAACCAVLTMFLVPLDAEYLGYIDFRVLCLLLCLMAVVAGFKSVGAFQWLTFQLLRRIRSGRVLVTAKPKTEYLQETRHLFWMAETGMRLLAEAYPENIVIRSAG